MSKLNGIPSSSYPDFRLSGRYDGETPAARWLLRLEYDFKRGGIPSPSPADMIHAIDMLAEGKAATFIDSHHRSLCDKEDPTSADVEKLCSSLQYEFPPILVDIIETPIQDQIRDLAQLEDEGLQAYTQRAARLLHKSGGKDQAKGELLPPLEAFALSQVVQAYLQGLWDQELRTAVIARSGDCTSLWRAREVVLEVKRSREAIARIGGQEDIESRIRELEKLKQVIEMPPPPSIEPIGPIEPNSSQKAHNERGYKTRIGLNSHGATLGYVRDT